MQPELSQFFSTYFSNSDNSEDNLTLQSISKQVSNDKKSALAKLLVAYMNSNQISLEDLGSEANRWFSDLDEAKDWLKLILKHLESEHTEGQNITVKDSNGTILSEGDSVTVIKDLKVKGGSSDLKRGTLIKNIHLTDDTENIECRVNGSTLVLKTMFLKKA